MKGKKNIYGCIVLFLFLVFWGIFQFYRSAFLQESNAFVIIPTTMFLEISGKEIVKVPFSWNEYVGKTKNEPQDISDFMSEKWYKFQDDIGRTFKFVWPNNERWWAQGRQFTRRYTLWHINFKILWNSEKK